MQDQLSLLLACRVKICVCCSNLLYSTWSSPNFLNRKYCCNICSKNLICGWCFFSYSMLYQKMYVKVNFFMSHNFCFSFVLGYDNVLYANEVETKEKQKLLNIKNELQHMYMSRTHRKIWSLQSRHILLCCIFCWCCPSSCVLAVLAMFLAIVLSSSYSWKEWNARHLLFSRPNDDHEAEYLMKNYGDWGGCYPSRP